MVANGAAVGIVAAFIGVVLGFSAWFAYVPHLQTIAEHRIDLVALPWWLIVTAIALAVTTAILAARWPARSFARIPVLAALSGRPAPAQAKETTALRGGILLAVGFAFVGFAGSSNQHGGGAPQVAIGLVAMIAGSIFLAPLAITELARFGRRMPIAVRLSLRDLDRYRARSGAALSAISIAVMIAVIICVAATGRFSNVLDYAGPNLPANQLIAYVGCTSSGCPTSPPTGSKAEAMRSEIAASLGTHDVLALDSAVDPKTANIPTSEGGNPTATLSQTNTRDNNYTGPLYVATPALLDFFGIRQSQVAPTTDILTARPGLAGLSNMQLLYGNAFSGPGPGPGSCPPGSCFNDPKIETVSNLPLGTSDPNTVITEHAVHAVGLQLIPTGWLFQTAKPLTPIQINDVRQIASGAGAMIETKSSLVGLSALTDWATAAGILLALGVLAMTVGLIRSETAPDLRILTATGASGGVRSALTGITAGALGLLGGLLGTAVAYLACVAFFRTKLGELGHPPALDLLLVILGMPLAAAIGGWLVAGREPPFIARQPIE
jgi:putative ABC transport system permease protein